MAQIIDHGPGVYAWFLVLQFYADICELEDDLLSEDSSIITLSSSKNLEKPTRRSKLMCFRDDGRNLLSQSTLQTITHCLEKKRGVSRSLDTLLDLKRAEEQTEELMDVKYDDSHMDNINSNKLNPKERAMKLLGITEDDINLAKYEKESRIYNIASDFILEALFYQGKCFSVT